MRACGIHTPLRHMAADRLSGKCSLHQPASSTVVRLHSVTMCTITLSARPDGRDAVRVGAAVHTLRRSDILKGLPSRVCTSSFNPRSLHVLKVQACGSVRGIRPLTSAPNPHPAAPVPLPCPHLSISWTAVSISTFGLSASTTTGGLLFQGQGARFENIPSSCRHARPPHGACSSCEAVPASWWPVESAPERQNTGRWLRAQP